MKKYILVLMMIVSPLMAQDNTKVVFPPVQLNSALKILFNGWITSRYRTNIYSRV